MLCLLLLRQFKGYFAEFMTSQTVNLFSDRKKKLDFEMAKKVPVSAVLSVWSILRDCYPSFVPCQEFSGLKSSKCIFFREVTKL